MFPSSTKREFRHFHVVVVQRRQRNVSKSVIHVQSCCFANLNLLLFCPRCRRRGRCLSSSVASASSCAALSGASRHPRLRLETELNLQWRIQGRGLGGGSRPPLIFRPNWGPKGQPPPPPPPLISRSGSGTDLSSDRLKFSDRICNWPLSGYCMAAIITPFVDLNDFFRYFKSWEAMNLTSSAYLEVMSKLVNMFLFHCHCYLC